MLDKIYKSSFRTGPDATKKQQMLFATDTAYALSEGYTLIQDSQGVVFQIIDEQNLLELGPVVDERTNGLEQEPATTTFDPQSKGFTPLSNLEAIDKIINTTLNQEHFLRAEQVDALLKLGQLKVMLGSTNL